jgi:hypothetical protein
VTSPSGVMESPSAMSSPSAIASVAATALSTSSGY